MIYFSYYYFFQFQRPWSVALLRYHGRAAGVRCGATLLSKKYVITAASCFFDEETELPYDNTNDFSVVLGSNDPIRTNEGIERKISRLVFHPKFIFRQAYYDIALVEMNEEVEFTMIIHPVCLPGETLKDIDLRDGRLVDIGTYDFISKTDYF